MLLQRLAHRVCYSLCVLYTLQQCSQCFLTQMHCATSSNALLATAPKVQLVLIIHAMQDVDGKLKDFQEKQNIDIGLIMGRGNNNASLVSDKMPVLPRANIMRMGATRSLSVSKSLRDLPTASCSSLVVWKHGCAQECVLLSMIPLNCC